MWGWIKNTAKKIGRGVSGFLGLLGQGIGWIIFRFLGIPELIISLLGFKPRKKLRLKVLILHDANHKPVASVSEVEALVDDTKRAFRREANIRIRKLATSDDLVSVHTSGSPDYVLTPSCVLRGYKNAFTRVGRWFRKESSTYTVHNAIVVFVVPDVRDKGGCFLALHSYGYIDRRAFTVNLLLAHEIGHGLDLIKHRKNPKNLMHRQGDVRTRKLTRWQRAVIRSSRHVTYR